MKTATALIGLSLLTLVHTTTHAAPLDVPADYKEHANQVEFLSNLATRCDTRLSVYGKAGLNDPICKDFLAKIPNVMQVNPTTQASWKARADRVDKSANRLVQVQWSTFHSELNRDLDLILKTLAHIKFYR